MSRQAPPVHLPAAVLAVVCVGASWANALLNAFIQWLEAPLFFDSVFTAIAAAVLGLPAGVAVGLLTNLWMEVIAGGTEGLVFLWFAPVNVLTAVVVAAFARGGRFRTPYHLLLCTAVVTLANSAAGAITVLALFGGTIDYPVDLIVTAVVLSGVPVWLSAFLARVPLNLIDKSVTVAIAFVVYRRVRRRSRAPVAPTL